MTAIAKLKTAARNMENEEKGSSVIRHLDYTETHILCQHRHNRN